MTTDSVAMTMDEVRAANRRAGLYFFDDDTMAFFGSKIHGGTYCGTGGVFFVTSEFTGFERAARAFSVRRFAADGIDTVGTIGWFDSLKSAQREAERLSTASFVEVVRSFAAARCNERGYATVRLSVLDNETIRIDNGTNHAVVSVSFGRCTAELHRGAGCSADCVGQPARSYPYPEDYRPDTVASWVMWHVVEKLDTVDGAE